jgi:NodT family efflux transporter outer membrane factor (OMF) lipoprotein
MAAARAPDRPVRRAAVPVPARALAPALLLAVVMAGCAVPGPPPRPEGLPVPARLPADSAAGSAAGTPGAASGAAESGQAGVASASVPASDLRWEDFLADARTRALVRLALANNRDLRIAAANVERARATLGVQRADAWPSIGIGASVSRSPGSDSYSAGLSLASYEVDLFGRVRGLGDAAAARLAASEEARRATALSLVAAVADTELALRADDALIDVTDRVLASREATLRLVRLKFDGGVSAEPELRANESLVASARAARAALDRLRAQRLNALVLLVGQTLPADLPAPRALAAHRLPELPADLPSAVLLQRPDVRQAERQLAAAETDIGAARAAFFPRMALTATLGTASSALSELFERTAWSFTGQLLQPLFDAGRNRANLAGAEAAREAALAQYEKTVQTAFREVADALAARSTLATQLQAQREQAAAEARRLALVEMLLAQGAASALERLDAERARLAAEQAVVQLELALRQNAVLLYRVLAGGTAADP